MASISGWVYIIIGVIVSAFSKFVETKAQSGSLLLFVIAGVIFIIIGVAKVMISHFTKKDELRTRQLKGMQSRLLDKPGENLKNKAGQVAANRHQQQSQQITGHNQSHHILALKDSKSPAHQTIILACHRCGARHYSFANYCMNCGTPLKKFK